MKQNINLYRLQTNKTQKLSFLQMMQALSGLGIILFCMTIYQIGRHFHLADEIRKAEIEKLALEQKLKSLEMSITAPVVKEEFEKKIMVMKLEQKSKQEIYSILTEIQSSQTIGFSRYFKALAAQFIPGIWLTQFKFGNGPIYISLEGVTLKAENVPKLMEGFSQEPVFAGETFQVFRLSVDPKTRHLHFELKTTDGTVKAVKAEAKNL